MRLHDAVFTVSSNKRTLRRRSLTDNADAPGAVSKTLQAQAQAARKLVGPRHRAASTAAAHARKRLASAAVAQSRRISLRSKASKAQPKKSCMFFNLFGRCDKMGKGCPYAHERSKVCLPPYVVRPRTQAAVLASWRCSFGQQHEICAEMWGFYVA